jgi:hypothetical protein
VGPTPQREKEKKQALVVGLCRRGSLVGLLGRRLTLEESRPELDVKASEFSFKNSLKFSLNFNFIQIQTPLN